jgi:zinc protease
MAAAFEWHNYGKTTIGAARRLEESRAYTRISRNYRKTAAANQTIETPDKANAMFTAGMPMNVRHAHPDYAALTLANYRLGGHSTARLYVRIRGKDGLSYSVNSMLPADAKDPRADWMVFAIANRINVAKLQTALQDEMVKAVKASPRTNGPTPRKAGCNRATSSDRRMALPPSASYPTSAKAAPWPSTWNWKEVSTLTVAEVNDGWRKHGLLPAFRHSCRRLQESCRRTGEIAGSLRGGLDAVRHRDLRFLRDLRCSLAWFSLRLSLWSLRLRVETTAAS